MAVRKTADGHCWDEVTATREEAEDPENQVGGGKGRGPSHWKSPEELAATAWEKELVVQ